MPCIECELPDLLLDSMPPDQDMVDLIEDAFLEGQTDVVSCQFQSQEWTCHTVHSIQDQMAQLQTK